MARTPFCQRGSACRRAGTAADAYCFILACLPPCSDTTARPRIQAAAPSHVARKGAAAHRGGGQQHIRLPHDRQLVLELRLHDRLAIGVDGAALLAAADVARQQLQLRAPAARARQWRHAYLFVYLDIPVSSWSSAHSRACSARRCKCVTPAAPVARPYAAMRLSVVQRALAAFCRVVSATAGCPRKQPPRVPLLLSHVRTLSWALCAPAALQSAMSDNLNIGQLRLQVQTACCLGAPAQSYIVRRALAG